MKNNGYTNIKQLKVQKLQSHTSALRSLRSLINQTKVPLSTYINNPRISVEKQKTNNGLNKMNNRPSYFQKLKGMIISATNNYQHQEYRKVTPNKINNRNIQNIEQQEFQIDQNVLKTPQINKNNSQYRKTINYCQSRQRSRCKSRAQGAQTATINPRHSIQPSKNFKTEQQTIIMQKQRSNLPPKQLNKSFNLRKLNIQNKSEIKKQQFSQIKTEKQKTQIVQNIHSYRRLNFYKQQQRRKQIILYKKNFQKICQNVNFVENRLIQSNSIEINQILGNGAFSYVKVGSLKNQQKGIFHKFAIKIYQKYKLIEPSTKKRVMKQIQILSSLNHPNIISLYSAYQNKRQIHIIFQQIENSITLQEYCKHRVNKNLVSIDEIIHIMKQILSGLCYLHSLSISHRDIKPDNILISFKDNQINEVKIIDFGFATTSTTSNVYCGTPNYMAPELFKKLPYIPQKSDMWSYGVMLYYLFQNKYPFKGYNEKDLIKNICEGKLFFQKCKNKQIQQIIKQLLHVDFQSRISSKDTLKYFNQVLFNQN